MGSVEGEMKKVSVIVPNYNYARYLAKRVSSITEQTYPIHEIVFLDDASTEENRAKIRELDFKIRSKFPNIRTKMIFNEANSGKAILQWKKGIEAATGDYIWIAEADDLARRDFLKTVMEGFDDSEVVISYTESAIINARGIMLAPNYRWSRDKEKTGHYKRNYVKNGVDEICEIMAIRCTIPNVSAAVFKKDARLLKYLDEAAQFKQAGDWYFYAKVLEDGKICYNRRALNLFRVHRGSATLRSAEHVKEVLQMHEYFRKKYGLSEQVLSAMEREAERVKAKYGIID